MSNLYMAVHVTRKVKEFLEVETLSLWNDCPLETCHTKDKM